MTQHRTSHFHDDNTVSQDHSAHKLAQQNRRTSIAEATATPLLYLITNDSDLPTSKSLLHAVGVALDAGVPWIQLRTKLGPRAPFPKFSDRAALATQLKKMCDAANAQLFINDEPSLAATCGAHLHMGQSDYSIATAREQLTATPWIGITCHNNIGLAKTAEQQGADYVSFGAFFSSHTKPNAHPASLDILTHPDQPPLPRVAIGGITLHNANQLLAAGADVLAVSHAILGAEDLRQACRDFLTLLSNTELRSNALNEKKQLEHG